MDVAALSAVMAQGAIQQQVSVQLAVKTMDVAKAQGSDLIKMMEQSVTPNIGREIDIKL